MANYDLTSSMVPFLDQHLVLPLLDFLQDKQLLDDDSVLKAKLYLLAKTNMVDYAKMTYKTLYRTDHVPQDLVEKRVELEGRLKMLHESTAPLISFLHDPALVQELGGDKQENLHMLYDRYQIGSKQIDELYQYAKFQFECGVYSDASEYMYHYLALCTDSVGIPGALWGKLACEILLKKWDVAAEEFYRLKDFIDFKEYPSSQNQLKSRTWLMHWSLFIFFNHDCGKNGILDLFFSERYLNIIQTNAQHLIRYVAIAAILNKSRRNMLEEVIKVIQHEGFTYSDPVTEFLECLYVNYDFHGAEKKLRECEKLIVSDFFLGQQSSENGVVTVPLRDEFMVNARHLIFHRHEQNVKKTKVLEQRSNNPAATVR